ncbi:hypothetical protein L1887_19245 [Cichorium endivia]|nr:hypothetical protein L1887_19245 [Cichorium endivia]
MLKSVFPILNPRTNLDPAPSFSNPQEKRSPRRDELKEGENIISTLPDALLTPILLFLPEADVKQTRFLSNRWKDIWAFLPNLRLIMPDLSEEAKKSFKCSLIKPLLFVMALSYNIHIRVLINLVKLAIGLDYSWAGFCCQIS